jgi:enoyl-CoA hydratase
MSGPQRRASGLTTETRGLVRLLTLDRPERRNALSSALQADLVEELLDCGTDPGVRAVVLTGTGPAFCAGFDLKEIREADERGEPFRPPMNRPGRNVFEVLGETFVPVIAALTGHAVAGGFELALACDIRIAAPGIRMGLPEAQIGMGANYGSVVLPRRIPTGLALEMLFTGDAVPSEEMARWGLVNRVVPADDVLPEALRLAERIAANAPLSVAAAKQTVQLIAHLPLDAAFEEAERIWEPVYLSDDAQEGPAAFRDKRPPRWKGR